MKKFNLILFLVLLSMILNKVYSLGSFHQAFKVPIHADRCDAIVHYTIDMQQINCTLWEFKVYDIFLEDNQCNLTYKDVEWHGPNNVEAFGEKTYFYVTDPTAVIEFCLWVQGTSAIYLGTTSTCTNITITNDPNCPPSQESHCNSTIDYCKLFNCGSSLNGGLNRYEDWLYSIRLIDDSGNCFRISADENPYGIFHFPYTFFVDQPCPPHYTSIWKLIQEDFPNYLLLSGHTGTIGTYVYSLAEIQQLAAQTHEGICKIKFRLLNSDLTMATWTTVTDRLVAETNPYFNQCDFLMYCGQGFHHCELSNCYPLAYCTQFDTPHPTIGFSDNMQQMSDELINFRTISNENDFSVFPNFASDNISIGYTNPYSIQSTVKIYNLNNQVIDKFDIKDATTDYDVSALASGMYIIELNDDTNHIKYMKKFIKL